MKRWLLLLPVLLFAALDTPRDATACGGPDYGDFGALAPLNATLSELVMPEAEWASWGNARMPELRFLYPFEKAEPKKAELAWKLAHEDLTKAAPPAMAPLDDAMTRDDLPAIDREARRIVSELLDMPAALASEHATLFWRAVELAELRPVLAKVSPTARRDYLRGATGAPLPPILDKALDARRAEPGKNSQPVPITKGHPRAASLELWAVFRELRDKVPNGYRESIKKHVAPSTFQHIRQGFEKWRKAHPTHPLVDYARLAELRVAYLSGDDAAAWQILLDMYPRHYGRVISEMRFLRVQGVEPTAAQVDALADPVLIAAVANDDTVTPPRFSRWWRLAGTAPNQQNLKERLLAWVATQKGPLPKEFPKQPASISPLAGKLGAIALLAAGRPRQAEKTLAKTAADPLQARLLVKTRLDLGQAEQAAKTPGLSPDVRRYIVSVLLPTAALVRLQKSKNLELASDARLEHAARLARSGRWKDAAKLMDRVDPGRAALYRHAAELTRQGAWLELARFFEDQRGRLFFGDNTAFYRGVSSRWESLSGSKEAKQIQGALVRSTERWLALEAYTRWLVAHPNDPDARDVLGEADGVYSRLTNFGGGEWFFWSKYQKQSPTIARLRKVGKAIRAHSL